MKDPKLILHVGTHKTGTTGIQFALSENRRHLRSVGVWYPSTVDHFPVDPKLSSTHAHFAFANAVARFSKRDRRILGRFVGALRERSHDVDRTVLSAESIYRHTAMAPLSHAAESEAEQHARFVDRLAAVLLGFDTEILMYLRRVDSFATSLYAEVISSSPLAVSFPEFLESHALRFGYRQQIDLFGTYFPLNVRGFEAAAQAGLLRSFCTDAGIPGPLPATPQRRRASVSGAGILWLLRAKRERDIEKTEQRRRWHFALLPENATLFESDRKTGFWRDRAERDAFVDRHQSNVPEVAFPEVDGDIAPPATWTEAQHADAERRFAAWQSANEEMLRRREQLKIPPHVLEDPPDQPTQPPEAGD